MFQQAARMRGRILSSYVEYTILVTGGLTVVHADFPTLGLRIKSIKSA